LFWESFIIYNKKTNIFQFGIILNNGAIVLDSFFQIFGKEISIFQKKFNDSKYKEFVHNHLGTMVLELSPCHPIDSPP
jgi:hypothetical protein